MENQENQVRKGVVPAILNLYIDLASKCCNETDEAYISLATYIPSNGIKKAGLTQITINGATYSLPMSLNKLEIDAILSELINLGATTIENPFLPSQFDYELQKLGSFGVYLSEVRNLSISTSENVIKK